MKKKTVEVGQTPMYFKDVAHSYGMSYERMVELGDTLVWV